MHVGSTKKTYQARIVGRTKNVEGRGMTHAVGASGNCVAFCCCRCLLGEPVALAGVAVVVFVLQ